MGFKMWDDQCQGCGAKKEEVCKIVNSDIGERESFFIFECPNCGYEGCPKCMPVGRGSNCEECVDPETGE